MNGHLHLHVFTELGFTRPERRVDDLHPHLYVLGNETGWINGGLERDVVY